MSVLSRIDSIPKGASGVCVSGFSSRYLGLAYIHQYEQALRDSLDRFRRGGLTGFTMQIDSNLTIVVSARPQDKHARVADGICRLIWNMRCKRRAFST